MIISEPLKIPKNLYSCLKGLNGFFAVVIAMIIVFMQQLIELAA